MKKKPIFNKGLYIETLRRLRLPAIIFLVILTVEAILVPMGYVISEYSYKADAPIEYVGSFSSYTPNIVEILELHPLIVISFFIITPILTWVAFSFLNKRNESDYYHALPLTRTELFVSRAAGVLTWIASLIVIPALVSRGFAALFPDVFSVVAGSYLEMIIGCFAASVFVMGVMTCAMAITGTVFTNIVVTTLIMFLPRFIMMFMANSVAEKFDLIPEAYISLFLSPKINIISGVTMGWFYDYTSIKAIITPTSQIYTLVAGLVYLVIGAVLFKARHSESADRSAPSAFMQSVYRIAVTMCICTPLTCICFTEGEYFSSSEVFLIVAFYICAVLAYFIYELVTTKKFKNLIRVLPGLLIVVLLNVALLTSLTLITNAEESFCPDAEDIKYIQIVSNNPNTASSMNINRFFQNETASIKITDKDAISIASESLERTIDTWANGYKNAEEYYNYTECTIKYKTAFNTEYRRVRMSAVEYDQLSDALASTEKYAKTWLTLPEAQKNTVSYSIRDFTNNYDGDKLFRIMKEEVATLNFETWYNFINNSDYWDFAVVTYATSGCVVDVPVSANLMPKTTAYLFEKLNEYRNGSYYNQFDKAMGILDDEYNIGSINLFTLTESGDYRSDYVNPGSNEIGELSPMMLDGDIEPGDSFIMFYYFGDVYNNIIIIKLSEDSDGILESYVNGKYYD